MKISLRASPPPEKTTAVIAPAPIEPTSDQKLTLKKINKLRDDIYSVVEANMKDAKDVLAGKSTWSNQQIKLFQVLLGKVMPDLQHKMTTIHDDRPANQLTRAQLEEIARGMMPQPKQRTSATPVIDVPPNDPDPSDAP